MNPFAVLIEPQRELLSRLAPSSIRIPPARVKVKKRPNEYANPWNIRPSEERFMQALVTHGGQAEAAKALGIAVKTANAHIRRIKERMNLDSTIHCVLEYDRWARE